MRSMNITMKSHNKKAKDHIKHFSINMSSILLVLNMKFNPQEGLERMSAILYNFKMH